MAKGDRCCHCNSDNGVRKFNDKWYCSKHYEHMKKYGKILKRTIYDLNEIITYDDYAEIVLYNKNCDEVARAIIDIEDIEKVKDIKWHLKKHDGREYAVNRTNYISTYMHRLIMGDPSDEFDVDHITSKGLDNRKNNLRVCTHHENSLNQALSSNNKSGVSGVYWAKDRNKWGARIKYNHKDKWLGAYENFEDAVRARLLAEKEYFGEFAPQSYLFEQYGIE